MTLEQDLENLKKKLTGDKKKDIKTLFASLDDYNDRPYLNELINEISNMLKNIVADTDKKTLRTLDAYVQKQIRSRYDRSLLEIKKLVDDGKFQEAIDATYPLEENINTSIEQGKRDSSENDISFRYYFSPMEFDLADTYFPGNNCMLPVDAVSLYILRGQAYFFLKEDEKAIDSIRYAFNFNPVSVDICFLLADIEKQRMNSFSYLSYIERAKDYIYKESDYLRYLKYLSDYYRSFEKDEKTAKTIDTLVKLGKTYKGITEVTSSKQSTRQKKLLNYLSKKKINIYISDNIIKTALNAYEECSNDKDTEGINYYKSILVSFLDKKDIPTIK